MNIFRNKILKLFIVSTICFSFVGCASLQRKFTRKKKKKDGEEMQGPVVSTVDYSKDLRADELYKKHFLFWKTWHTELIDRLDDNVKKRSSCYDYLTMHLDEMCKYMNASKAKEIDEFRVDIKKVEKDIKKRNLSNISRARLKRFLEKSFRQITKRFSYSDVEGSLELRK